MIPILPNDPFSSGLKIASSFHKSLRVTSQPDTDFSASRRTKGAAEINAVFVYMNFYSSHVTLTLSLLIIKRCGRLYESSTVLMDSMNCVGARVKHEGVLQ